MVLIRSVVAVTVLASVVPWIACSSGDDDGTVAVVSLPTPSETTGEVRSTEFCSVVEEEKLKRDLGMQAELEELQRQAGQGGPSSTPVLDLAIDVLEWGAEVAAHHALPLYEALIEIAPPEIESDLEVTYSDHKAIAEGKSAIPQNEAAAEARQRVVEWINERCQTSYRPGDM
jgi:hypothetical protein